MRYTLNINFYLTPLNSFLPYVAIVFVLAVLVYLWRNRTPKNQGRYKPRAFLSPAEKEFFATLSAAVPELHVFPQVSMGAIMESTSSMTSKDEATRKKALGEWSTVRANRIDFCIVDRDLELRCLVELDDKSHASNDAKKKDRDRDARVAEAGYTTVRFGWVAGKLPSPAEVRARLAAEFPD